MFSPTQRRWPGALSSMCKRTGLLAVLAVLAALAMACGSGEDNAGDSPAGTNGGVAAQPSGTEVPRVFAESRIYSIADLTTAGMKVLNEYEVKEFPGALTAYHGAFNKIEYEARFYTSHDDAVQQGAGPADEVSGPDAVVTGDNVKYQEGATHRRLCSRAAQTPHSGCSYSARYGDYIIKGNMVLMCEGIDTEHAMLACNDLLKGVPPQ
jgi:hypothetical protein